MYYFSLFVFFCRHYIKALFINKSVLQYGLIIIVSIAVIFYAFIASFVISYSNSIDLTKHEIVYSINLLLFFILLIKNLLIFYHPLPLFLERYMPIPAFVHFILHVLKKLISYSSFGIYLFLFIIFLLSPVSLLEVFGTFICLSNAYSFEILTKILIEKDVNKKMWITSLLTLLTILFIGFNFFCVKDNVLPEIYVVVCSAFSFFNIIIGVFSLKKSFDKTHEHRAKYITNDNILQLINVLIFRRKSIYIALLVYFLLKITIISLVAILNNLYKTEVLSPLLLALFISPTFIFTYILNNFWGYLPQIWYLIYFSGRKILFKSVYWIGSIIPISIDLFLSIPFYQEIYESFTKFILFYGISSLACIINGYCFSILQPALISKSKLLDRSINVSILSTATSLLIATLAYYQNYYAFSGIIMIINISVVYLLISPKIYIRTSEKLLKNA
ncbi:MAG: hypothetical protein NZM44_07395 [Candidatus Calescibacterium sp.]|nr:hypothetical protein [Candidatus Calescibacterium sp.]